VSNSPWEENVAIKVSQPMQPRRPKWPWEQSDNIQRKRDFLREYICEVYLVRAFDGTVWHIHGKGEFMMCGNYL